MHSAHQYILSCTPIHFKLFRYPNAGLGLISFFNYIYSFTDFNVRQHENNNCYIQHFCEYEQMMSYGHIFIFIFDCPYVCVQLCLDYTSKPWWIQCNLKIVGNSWLLNKRIEPQVITDILEHLLWDTVILVFLPCHHSWRLALVSRKAIFLVMSPLCRLS